jgi:3-hydroxyacyl-CoA dehydrogenase
VNIRRILVNFLHLQIAILVKNGNGFIVNRLQYIYYDRSLRLMSDFGLHPYEVDQLFESFGIAVGPIRFMDLCGNIRATCLIHIILI